MECLKLPGEFQCAKGENSSMQRGRSKGWGCSDPWTWAIAASPHQRIWHFSPQSKPGNRTPRCIDNIACSFWRSTWDKNTAWRVILHCIASY